MLSLQHPEQRHRCACTYCRCRNFAQEPVLYFPDAGMQTPCSSPTTTTPPQTPVASASVFSPCPCFPLSAAALSAAAPPPTLCLVCERAALWGKTKPSYAGCRCTCRCKQRRAFPDAALCHDCEVQNDLNPRRHRPHGAKGAKRPARRN
ncbi:hypothetical protein GGS23DRAFT_598283 [Durotheca rogersii]|uniref:uncharacterized protein n=1 Tax=Durotheca rogersii TaxID=419775 RepID=UPI00221F30ED|nr:uncharacterized protein GGS23DRAFT_598283 [Durotheca rogersii]KAI5861502.1 hypothetical protein GGS23DRAFT_598283 [Durotheca rogersii]